MISSEQQLEDLLSEPSAADARAMAEMNGDLVILGVGGKMGPSLSRRALLNAANWHEVAEADHRRCPLFRPRRA